MHHVDFGTFVESSAASVVQQISPAKSITTDIDNKIFRTENILFRGNNTDIN